MFEHKSDARPPEGVGRVRKRLGRVWGHSWPIAVMLLVVGGVVMMLVTAMGMLLPADATPAGPTVPAGSILPGGSTPVALVAVRTSEAPLSERSGPSTYNPIRGHLADGAAIGVLCQVYGQRLTGRVSTSAWWEVDVHGLYISDAWLSWSPARPAMPWCGATTHRAVTATVDSVSDGLSIRTGPGVGDRKVGSLPTGAVLAVECRSWGGVVSGTEGVTATWSRLADGRYVSDAYVRWSPEQPFMPWCGEDPQSVPPATRTAFIAQAVAPAQANMERYRVPAAVTIAQAILESGAGASGLTRVDHSVFGMKCFGDPGPVAVGCRDYATHECDSHGACFSTHASFRAYRSQADSFADHGLLLAGAARYQPAFAYSNDPDKFARALQKAGYATSPKYADNLISVMRLYDLYQYDHFPGVSPPTHIPQ